MTRAAWPLALALAALGARPLDAGWLEAAFDGAAPGGTPPAAAGAPAIGDILASDARFWVVLPASGARERTRIAAAGVSIEEVGPSTVAGVAHGRALLRLQKQGIRIERQTPLERFGPQLFPRPDEAFHDYAEVRARLTAIASAHKDLASMFSIGTSHEGRDLLAIRFNTTASGAQPSDKPGIVFLGTHHAREHLSTEVPLLLAQWLADNRSRPDVRRLLASRDVYFVPLVNPDGAEYDHADGSYRWQRKNLRRNEDGSLGVDLNRNYGWRWGGDGASDDPASDTYRGPSAFSEPESRAVKRFVEERPNLKVLLSYHTFSELILYPWGGDDRPIEDTAARGAFQAMAEKMAGWTGYTAMQSADLYVATGDTCDWAWGEKKIFAFTFELTPRSSWNGGFYPGAAAIRPTLEKNIAPALYLMEMAEDPYRARGDS